MQRRTTHHHREQQCSANVPEERSEKNVGSASVALMMPWTTWWIQDAEASR